MILIFRRFERRSEQTDILHGLETTEDSHLRYFTNFPLPLWGSEKLTAALIAYNVAVICTALLVDAIGYEQKNM
jgi:hypothetical protein